MIVEDPRGQVWKGGWMLGFPSFGALHASRETCGEVDRFNDIGERCERNVARAVVFGHSSVGRGPVLDDGLLPIPAGARGRATPVPYPPRGVTVAGTSGQASALCAAGGGQGGDVLRPPTQSGRREDSSSARPEKFPTLCSTGSKLTV